MGSVNGKQSARPACRYRSTSSGLWPATGPATGAAAGTPTAKADAADEATGGTLSLAGVAVEAAACPHGAVAGVSSTFQPWSTLAHIAASGAASGATSGAAPGAASGAASALALVASIPMAPY